MTTAARNLDALRDERAHVLDLIRGFEDLGFWELPEAQPLIHRLTQLNARITRLRQHIDAQRATAEAD